VEFIIKTFFIFHCNRSVIGSCIVTILFGAICSCVYAAPITSSEVIGAQTAAGPNNIARFVNGLNASAVVEKDKKATKAAAANKTLVALTFNRNSHGKYFLKGQYARALHQDFGVGVSYKYAETSSRLSGTVGFNINKRSRFKITAERANQIIDAKFSPYTDDDDEDNFGVENGDSSSGNSRDDVLLTESNRGDDGENNSVGFLLHEKRITQDAYGVRYQYMLPVGIFRDISVGGYYTNTPNVLLNSDDSGYAYSNIAGATVKGIDIGTSVNLSKTATVNSNIYYDDLRYNTEFYPTKDINLKGLGFSLELTNIFTPRVKFSASASLRQPFDSYGVGIHWLPPMLTQFGPEISLTGQSTFPDRATSGIDMLVLQIKFTFDEAKRYRQSSSRTVGNIASWVDTSSINMSKLFVLMEK